MTPTAKSVMFDIPGCLRAADGIYGVKVSGVTALDFGIRAAKLQQTDIEQGQPLIPGFLGV